MQILLHAKTEAEISGFIKSPSHALLLVGRSGMGKAFMAEYIATQILQINTDQLKSYPYFLKIMPDEKSTISIDQIRTIKTFMGLTTKGVNQIRRVIVIEDAHNMPMAAQNSLLKSLEEPPQDTLIMLTASNSSLLLPTINSRAHLIDIRTPNKLSVFEFFQSYPEIDVTRAFLMSGGRPGLMSSLLNNQESELLRHVSIAKEVLVKKTYQRLKMVNELLSKDNDVGDIIEGFYVIVYANLKQQIQNENYLAAKRMQKSCDLLQNAKVSLSSNPSPKLLLTDLLIQL